MKLVFDSNVEHAPGAVREASVLGGFVLGTDFPSPPPWPVQAVPAPLLGSSGQRVHELWRSDGDCRSGNCAGIAFRRAGGILFGVLEIDEVPGQNLQQATESAYRRIFRLLEVEDLPCLWRVWNYLAGINCEERGMERYRQFNVGRHDAFVAAGRAASGEVPAACTLGLRQGKLSIAFLAGSTPARSIENPRQLSAYHYPAEYGPRSPTFSRAVLVELPGQETLFISGTASIVGHRSVHPGDVAGQCREALANVDAVVGEANRISRSQAFSLAGLAYRVYVRNGADYPVVREVLAQRLAASTERVFIEAAICRQDLLLEIEALASQAVEDC